MIRKTRNTGLLAALAMLILFSSCAVRQVTSTQKENTSLTPNRVEVHLNSDDINYLGEVSIDIDYRFYLGIIRVIDNINGVPFELRKTDMVKLTGPRGLDLSPMLQRASYKIAEKYPDADYFVVNISRKTTRHMFMGRFVKEEATVKAYKIAYGK